jgi:hypothetical protein
MKSEQPTRQALAREHELVGWCNPRCLRCHRTVIDLVTNPAPCRPSTAKAALMPRGAAERAVS